MIWYAADTRLRMGRTQAGCFQGRTKWLFVSVWPLEGEWRKLPRNYFPIEEPYTPDTRSQPFIWQNGQVSAPNEWSWANLSSVLYVEHPVGTGFTHWQGQPNDENARPGFAGYLDQRP